MDRAAPPEQETAHDAHTGGDRDDDDLRAQVANLLTAVESRDCIGQAKGLLMARQNIDGDVAFDLLRRASQRENVKLSVIARRVVAEHEAAVRSQVESGTQFQS